MMPNVFEDATKAPAPGAPGGESIPTWGDLRREEESATPKIQGAEGVGPEAFLAGFEADDGGDTTTAPAQAKEKPADQPTPEPPDLAAQLRSANEKIENLEKRWQDTHTWGNQAHADNRVAEQILRAQQARDELQRRWYAEQQALAAPDLSDLLSDPDDLLSDGKRLAGAFSESGRRFAEWGYRRAVSEVSPYLGQLQQVATTLGGALPLLRRAAQREAQEKAIAEGVVETPEQWQELARRTSERIAQEAGGNAHLYELDPAVFVASARLVASREGVPVQGKSRQPVSVEAGKGGGAPAKAGGKRSSLSKVERALGVSFGDEESKEFSERWSQAS